MSKDESQSAAVSSPANLNEEAAPKTELWPEIGLAAHIAVFAVLAAVVIMTFVNTLVTGDPQPNQRKGFALDNKFIILEDPRLQASTHENIKQIFTQDYWWPKAVSGLYRPLTTLSYMVNYSVFGNKANATYYHVVNLLIHWMNAVLVYLVVLILMGKQWPAIFAAILFATHPIVTESVTNIVGRADLFATMSVLLSFVLYARSGVARDPDEEEEEINWKWAYTLAGISAALIAFCVISRTHSTWLPEPLRSGFWVVTAIAGLAVCTTTICAATAGVRPAFWLFLMMVATTIGVFSKESAVVVLGVMLLYDFTYRMRKLHPNMLVSFFKNFWGFAWKGYVVMLVPLVSLWYVRSWVFDQLRPPELPFVDNPMVGWDFWTARITAIKVIGKYFWLLIWPQTLSCDYSFDQIKMVHWDFAHWEDLKALVALALIILLIVVAIRNYFRNKAVFFFIFFFFGTMLPTSNLFPKLGEPIFQKETWCIGSIMAERFMYMSSIGFAGCVVIAVYAICRRIIPELDISAWAQRIWLQIVARCALALIALAFGVRAFMRNVDWEDDVNLWSQAVIACPDSFKTHKSLAYALYENDPEFKDIDRIIMEGEKAVQITDRTQIVFLHLGAYYRIKGDLLSQKKADGSLVPSDASREWYQKSANTLERAVPLDREFNSDNRRKELKRGRKETEIPDIGNHEIYWNLGLSYARLQNYQKALEAYLYMRHLAPTNPDAYLSVASVYIGTGHLNEAAVALMQTLLLDSNRQEAMRLLVDIYRQIDTDGCAVISTPSRPAPQLNAECKIVKQHICQAYAGLSQIFTEARQYNLAAQTKENAIKNYKCGPEVFDTNATPAAAEAK